MKYRAGSKVFCGPSVEYFRRAMSNIAFLKCCDDFVLFSDELEKAAL